MTATPTLRVLCLDIEGGYGGSSRSLFESLRHMKRAELAAEVWCKKAGPVQARYAEVGIPARVTPAMPTVSSLRKFSRNALVYARFMADWRNARGFRSELASAAAAADAVHCNHEGLFLMARWLQRETGVPLAMHVRTNLSDTPFARWQERTIAATADHVVFITENERNNFERLAGRRVEGTVIFNPVALPDLPGPRHPSVAEDGRFRVVSLATRYSHQHGTDRVIDMAAALAARGRRDIAFVVAGETELQRSLPGVLGELGRRGGTLADYAKHRNVEDMITFLGFVTNPDQVLAAGDILFMPTRERIGGNLGHPWGRAVLEAMAAGLPVMSIGRYDRFVETGVTGILLPDFDSEAAAEEILRLAGNREATARMGANARARVAELCDAPARAADLLAVWRRIGSHKAHQTGQQSSQVYSSVR